ncbi:MAG: flagellar hook protein FlgE [Proteobacteria bacterium]|nr:flagellar hook protein FlgE [Pseudomonadota bacterium]
MSFQQALSGLNASSQNLDVIGNNVANAQTVGTKASRAEFSDVYANALTQGGGSAVGIGVQVQAVTQQFTQGGITATGNPSDLAINGNGFFEVLGTNGTVNYTRNGQFQISKDGNIVTSAGAKLMGYPADNNGTIQPGTSLPLTLPTQGVEPKVTSQMKMEVQLDSTEATTYKGLTPAINFNDATTYNRATSVTAYDAKGQTVALTYYFQKSADDTWNVYATANGASVSTDGSGNPTPISTVTFSADGKAPVSPVGPISFDIPSTTNANGATTLPITGVSLDMSTATQYGEPFAVTNLTQDGYTAGQVTGLQVDPTGVVLATYSNGQTKAAGQVELATFRDPQGLKPIGGNLWSQTVTSGAPIVGTPGSANMGVLQSGAVEESNVDLTSELVNMIVAQRTYQANAQTIKTIDQVLQTLVSLR